MLLPVVLLVGFGLVAVAPQASAQTNLVLAPIVPPNTSNSTTTYTTTIVLTGVDLPVAPAADMGIEVKDFVSVVDSSDDWTAGYGTSSFLRNNCNVTIGASTSTLLIVAVGNEGLFCNDDYVQPNDSITVNLVDANGNQLATASGTATAATGNSATTVPVVSSVSPQYGPEGGGTTIAPGTGTVAVNTGSATTPEAFWFGGKGLSGFYGVATTNFTADPLTAGVWDVVPPAFVSGSTTPQNYGVSVFSADSTFGMSDQDCDVEITGCNDEYLYTDSHTGSVSLDLGNGLSWSDALKTAGGTPNATGSTACGTGSTSGTSASLSVGGTLTGGPIDLSGGVDLSDSNSGIPEAFVANAALTVTNPLVLSVNLTGQLGVCEEIGIPDLNIPGVGGLYFLVGGNISAAVSLTITIAAGTYSLTGGWIPGAHPFATLNQTCTDPVTNLPTNNCITTQLAASLSGTLTVSPLWLQLGPNVANVGAGLTAAATANGGVTYTPGQPPVFNADGDICVAGNYVAQVNVGNLNLNYAGDWLGPYNVYGDGNICPLGPITAPAAPTVPGVPIGLTASPGDTTAALSWTPPASDGGSAITGYNVYEGTTAGGESTTPLNSTPLPAGTTTYTATGLTDGTTYFFTVTAVNSAGESQASNEASATPAGTATVPGAPIDLTASPGDTTAALSWTPPASDGGSPITGYNVYEGTTAGGESTTPINSTPVPIGTPSYTATGLTNGTTYYFTVTAINGTGESPASNEASALPVGAATAPGAPLSATATPGDSQATVNWSPPASDGDSPITGYNVYEGTAAGGESTTPANLALLPADATSFVATGLTNGTPYFFTVTAVNVVGESVVSNEVTATPASAAAVPEAPLNVTASPGDTQATVSWSPPASDGGSPITGYNVYEGTAAGGESTTPVNSSPLPASATSYTATGLTNGTPYFFTVTAVNAIGEGPVSNEATATPAGTATVPGAPLTATASPGDGQATVYWSPPASDGGSPITGYNVYEGTAAGGESTTPVNSSPLPPSATSYTATGLTDGTTYFFTVTAVNAVGESVVSNEVSATPSATATVPSAPLTATASPGDGQATVSWSPPASDGGSPITGYNVYEGTTAGGESTTPVNSGLLAPTASSFAATGLTDGTTYYFTVTAVNAVGESVVSNEVSATPSAAPTVPGAPLTATVSPGDGQATVSWSPPASDGGSPITGYNVYEGTAAGGESTTPVNSGLLAPTASSFAATGLTDGTTYYFTVTAVNAVGESVVSNEVSATPSATATVPGAPLSATASPGDGQATVSWSPPASDGGSPITGYNVYEGTAAGGESTTPVNSGLLAPTASSFAATGLTDGTTYYFTVTAVNAVGESVVSNEVSGRPSATATVPGAPLSATASPGDGQATVSWSPPASDGGSPITGYNVYEGTTAGGESTTPVNSGLLAPTATSFAVTGLTDGTTYYFTVTAVNAVGESVVSNEVSATPSAAPTVPSVPLSATASPGDGQATVSWLPPASDGGSPITGYNVYEGTTAGGESTTPVNSGLLAPTATSFAVTGLTDGTTYYLTVTAVNAVGESVVSNEVSATPSATATVPSAPLSAIASPGDGQATVSWSPPASDGGSPITGYNVYEGTTAGGESTTPVNSGLLAPTATSFAVTGLTDGTTYFFTVVAVNAVGSSVVSNEVSATPSSTATVPSAPLSATASPGNGQATVSWSPPASDGGSPIIGYTVYEGTTAGGESPISSSLLPPSATTYTVTGLTNGTLYFFTVVAVNAVGPSVESNEVSAQPAAAARAPGAPLGPSATPGKHLVTVHWLQPSSNGGSPITGYDVYIGTAFGKESTTPVNTTPLCYTARSFGIGGLTRGTVYYFDVKAINAAGLSGPSAQVSEITATVPSPPLDPGVNVGKASIKVFWSAPASDGGSAVTGYNVYLGTASGQESATPVNPQPLLDTVTSYRVHGLTHGPTYYLYVKAINGLGLGQPSAEVYGQIAAPRNRPHKLEATAVTVAGASSVKVHGKIAARPSRPRKLKADLGARSFKITWSAPKSDGGAAITGYDIYVGTVAGKESKTPINVKPLATNATSYILTGLTRGTRYFIIVKAINTRGTGAASVELSVKDHWMSRPL